MPLYVGSTPVTIPGMGGGAAGLPTGYRTGQTSALNVVVTAGGVTHTMGAWTELIAATTLTSNLATLYPVVGVNAVSTDMLIDIALGAVGAEVPFITNLAVGGIQSPWPILLPVAIPAGSRVSMRSQTVTAARTSTYTLYLYAGVPASVASSTGTLDVLPATTPSTSRAITVVASNGWVEAAAATARAYSTVILVPSVQGQNNPLVSPPTVIKSGSGAPGAEVTLAELSVQSSNTESVWTGPTHASPLLSSASGPVPAGSRLSIATSSTTSHGLCLIGVPA